MTVKSSKWRTLWHKICSFLSLKDFYRVKLTFVPVIVVLERKFVGCSVEIGKAAENSLDNNSSDSNNAEYEHEDCPQILLLILRFLEMVC